MNENIVVKLDKAYYVRSKMSNYPISDSILPVPDGMSVVIFHNKHDIDQYFQIRGIIDSENFDILPVTSFYDFMREIATMGFIGIWYFNNFPILLGNYVSDIDIEIPSFAYTYDDQFIGASGKIDTPPQSIPWKNFSKTDKIIRRFVKFVNGVPFNPKAAMFTIVYTDKEYCERIMGDKEHYIKYCRFPDASPLQGPYVSDMGAYCLFTDEENAQRYLSMSRISDKSIYAIEKVDSIHSFLDSVTVVFPFIDIGINPGNERYLQGYFLRDQERWLIKMVLGVYEVIDDCNFLEFDQNENISSALQKSDTIEKPNTIDPSLRGFRTTIKNPLKSFLGSTKSSLPRREAEQVINKIIKKNKYVEYPDADYNIESQDISTDSFLVFGFDKITGDPFGNNEELLSPYVFKDILDAILYFYHIHFTFEYNLRFDGFFHCSSNTKLEGSQDVQLEKYLLSEQKIALQDLMKLIFTEGCKLEHSELLKSYVNRSSVSLEIEECGYLGDLAIFKDSYLESNVSEHVDSDISERIIRIARKHKTKLSNMIQLDEKFQNRIRIYLGCTYKNVSIESLLILESALKQFDSAEHRINHDYAGITMKICKVFERELNILIYQSWRYKILKRKTKTDLKNQMKQAENNGDKTTYKLVGWLLKRNKIELGSMTYVIKRIVKNCDNDILKHFSEYISILNNHEFILSQNFLEICKLISTRYRNGGVHEKIVTYDICMEAFENILMKENNYIKELANI